MRKFSISVSGILSGMAYTDIFPSLVASTCPSEIISPRCAAMVATRTVSPHSISGKIRAGVHSMHHLPFTLRATMRYSPVISPARAEEYVPVKLAMVNISP